MPKDKKTQTSHKPKARSKEKKKEHPTEKEQLHPRNRHRARYEFKLLKISLPELAPFVKLNIHQDESIDFADPAAVKMLNRALLKQYYQIINWDIPEGYLCPPIPGRADYIHHIADLLGASNFGTIPQGSAIRCLDLGIGANCVYPIIGVKEYGWSFVGSDIDAVALESANRIIAENPVLTGKVECRLQPNPKNFFKGIIQTDEYFDLSICNPPFHASAEAAEAATLRKLSNLQHKEVTEVVKNFGGQNQELWCEGGEEAFVREMVRQSKQFGTSCFWFSSLISKQSHLKYVYEALTKAGAVEVKTIPMGQGNKTSRVVAWTFLTKDQQAAWKTLRWGAKSAVVDKDDW
jgi:23S rRNA (adenine1618-N6)-methyltransferase